MKFYILFFLAYVFLQFYLNTPIEIKPKFQRNTLNFGYGVNYKYEGMLAHSFDRFYVVTKFMLPMIGDLKFSKPFVTYYSKLIHSYNKTAHNILENEIRLLLPQNSQRQKCGIITTLVSSFIGLAYEGISSFLQ